MMRRMGSGCDVLVVLPYYHPETTGHCQSFNSLLPYLAAKGLRVAVVTSDRMYSAADMRLPPRDTHHGVTVRRVKAPAARRVTPSSYLGHAVSFGAKALALAARMRPRAVLCITSPPLLYVLLGWAARMRHVPLLLWAMDLYPEVLVETGLIRRGGFAHRTASMLARAGYRECTKIFTLGPCMSRRIEATGVSRDKLVEVHNWVPEEIHYVPESGNRFLAEQCLAGRFVVHYSGNMGLVHTFDTLLDAASVLAKTDPRVLFILAGHGPKRRALEERIGRERLSNARVLDYVPPDRFSESLSAASLGFVALEPGMEGIIAPGKIYGYLKVGTPVALVQASESDLSRIVRDDVEGREIRPGDVEGLVSYIRELQADPGRLAEARRRNAAWYARHCALEINAGRFLETLRNLPNWRASPANPS